MGANYLFPGLRVFPLTPVSYSFSVSTQGSGRDSRRCLTVKEVLREDGVSPEILSQGLASEARDLGRVGETADETGLKRWDGPWSTSSSFTLPDRITRERDAPALTGTRVGEVGPYGVPKADGETRTRTRHGEET